MVSSYVWTLSDRLYTVPSQDIVLTLKEKLSLRSIAHFALALEEQYNVAKIHLLHEEELIDQVRRAHTLRCSYAGGGTNTTELCLRISALF